MWLKCRQNLMHFIYIFSHFTFRRRQRKNGRHFCRREEREWAKQRDRKEKKMLLVTDLVLFCCCCFCTERDVSCRIEDSVVWFHTELYTKKRLNKQKHTKFENATLYLYLSWIAIIWEWTLEIPINKVSRSSHQLAKIGHVENGADICFYFSSLFANAHTIYLLENE